MYEVSAYIHNLSFVDVLLAPERFHPDTQALLDSVKPDTKILLLFSPNNPTVNTFDDDRITALL